VSAQQQTGSLRATAWPAAVACSTLNDRPQPDPIMIAVTVASLAAVPKLCVNVSSRLLAYCGFDAAMLLS